MIDSQKSDALDRVAIIGMAGRFPGAVNVEDLWRNVCEGVESITFFGDNELDPSVDSALKDNQNYVKARGILEDVDKFDAAFFSINPREAEIMDPQQRIFLEVAWQALENAGYDPDSCDGLIGVYGGTGVNSYFANYLSLQQNVIGSFGEHKTAIANAPDYLVTRVSYKLNLRGPSVGMYTGCSLSLVAVCQGFESLMTHQSDIVLAGGIFIYCPQNRGYLYQEGEIFSADGHCRPFDARATGTVFSNGVGIVVLKRLEDALKDADYIYGIIRGTALNNDGSQKVSFTAPSVDGQAEVIAMAHANADVNPETISYVETHGTGTPVGDPIEIAALTQAFRAKTAAKHFCAIGSIKGNIGHLDAAAGIAGLIKTTLMLKHRVLPPSLHFEESNPKIDFAGSPFYVNTKLSQWETNNEPRRAGVSSFGVGGTNAHVVLEEAPVREASGPSRPWKLLLLSAKTSSALDTMTRNLVLHVKQSPDIDLADVAYTLQIGRKGFSHRRMIVCKNLDDAVTALESLDQTRVITSFHEPTHRDVVFMFSGQGSQYVNMGLELYRTESIFREQIDRCSEILQAHLSLDLRDILYPAKGNVEEVVERLKQTSITQPALFTIEYALAQLWMSWGVRPEAMVGHSIGEYVAACLAGVFSLEDALSVVATRGRLTQELPGGSMLAVFLSEQEMQPLLGKNLSLAVANSPCLCVVSGEKEAVEDLGKHLSKKNVDFRHLHTSHAFHSQMMDPILHAFAAHLSQVKMNPPQIPFLSNLTGTWITPDEAANANYWAKHLRQTVRFSDCVRELLKEPNRVLLEVGPGQTLSTLARQHQNQSKQDVVFSSTRQPKERKSDVAFILNTLGQLWLAGIQIDWAGFYANENRHRLPLPSYPFEGKRHWIDTGKQVYTPAPTAPRSSKKPVKTAVSNLTYPEQKIDNIYNDASGNDIEQIVANIWQDVLGTKQVRIHDNFFDLGGDSLLAVQLFAQVERMFGKKLPLATLYDAPTIEQLANILLEEEWRPRWASLVEIQSGDGSKPPFFLVHGAGGNILIYRDLARHLDSDQPVYGLQSQGLDGEGPFHTRIEDMASYYLKEIKAVQSQEPYLLGGYCMGGTVALEMAQQLYAQGHEVALLVFLETYNYSNIPAQSLLNKGYFYLQKINFHWRNFLLLSPKEKLTFIKEKAKVARGRRKVWFGMVTSKIGHTFHLGNRQNVSLFNLWEANDRAALSYVPKPYPGRVIQFRPMKEYAHHEGPQLGWEELAADGLEIHELPVYPGAMLVQPFVRLLAEKLKIAINKV